MLSHIDHALAAKPGSANAIAEAQQAIFHLMQTLTPALPDDLLFQDDDEKKQRGVWIRTIQFLLDAHVAPQLRSLSIGLQELDRGNVVPGLVPKIGGLQGGAPDTDELRLRSFAVEAADELRRRCISYEEYRAELKLSGTQASTISDYRKDVLAGPRELHPRGSYILSWGDEPPEMLLQRIVWAIRDLRKQRRKPREAESS